MAFITDKEELKPGLIIFHRTDVKHREWYCRVKLPKADRYKTVSLKTSDKAEARSRAFDHDADVRFRIKHEVPVFNRPFSQIAEEYVLVQERRARTGEITEGRVRKVKSVIRSHLDNYVGTTQIHLVGQDRWDGYPTWRRENSTKSLRDQVSDATISFEMAKAEITNKIAARGAWLVGESVGHRLTLFKTFSDLYAARSTTVHTGNASGKIVAQMPDFDAAVLGVVRALLDRGAFPDWKALVLGG